MKPLPNHNKLSNFLKLELVFTQSQMGSEPLIALLSNHNFTDDFELLFLKK